MYLVQIYNDELPITINDTHTNTSQRVMGEVTQGINKIDHFTFSIYPNNAGYQTLQLFQTRVTVFNEQTHRYEFRGRVLLIEHLMDSSGLIYKQVTCESELGFFHDSYLRYKKYENVSVSQFLKDVLDHHNGQVSEEKRFLLGNVEFNDTIQREVSYISTWECLKTRLFENSGLGGELVVRHEEGKRYLDYVKEKSQVVTDSPIQLAVNLLSLTNEDDFGEICTRLIPLGAKLEGSEERVSIKSVHEGKDYLDDPEGIQRYGVIEKVVMWDDVHEAAILLKRGQAYLSKENQITRKFSINAVDLSLIGLNPTSYQVGNYYTIVHPLMGIKESLRVIEKKFSIESPEAATLTFGSLFDNIQDYQKNAIQASLEAKELASLANSNVNVNQGAIHQLNQTVVNQQTQLNTVNIDIAQLGNLLSNLQGSLTGMNQEIIQSNQKVEQLTKRIMMEVF